MSSHLETISAIYAAFGRGEPEIAFHLFWNVANGQRGHGILVMLSVLAI